MLRSSFPSGQSNASMAKALLRHIDATRGPAQSEAWLKRVHMLRGDLDDETRPMRLDSLHEALVEFVKLYSRDTIRETWGHLVAPDVLGAWTRILRGTTEPSHALEQIDAADGEFSTTTRWETLDVGLTHWRGRMHITHDPEVERDGLLGLARATELSAVPALFGYGRATESSVELVFSPNGLHQDFLIRWRVPSSGSASVVGVLAGAACGAVPIVLHVMPLSVSGPVAVVAAILGGLSGALWSRDRLRRAESRAQTIRVHALERGMLLREKLDRVAAGSVEGSVVAGQYRVRKRMGSGASGVIYEAVRMSDGMPVAIKLLRAAAAHDAVASDRLRREAEALGLAWHPNVVEVIDHGLLPDGTSYLVMELLEGQSLATKLQAGVTITLEETREIALRVCDALVAVHAAGVVHRDLKPSNIFLAIDRDDPAAPERVKILDFGIARVEWEETRITNMGVPLGTAGYMSPEQESGGHIDFRTDLFALGAVVYECLVGEPPPRLASSGVTRTSPGFSLVSLGSRFDWTDPKIAPKIPPSFRAIIEKAMAAVPEDRFEDARAFAQALRDATAEVAEANSQV